MKEEVYLTGITTTGTPHIGNFVGAIRPSIVASKDAEKKNFYFLADFHALAKNEDPDKISQSTLEIAAAWLALGMDTGNSVFYRQSDIPEIPELTWILTSMTAKGLMNRAHSYKAALQSRLKIPAGRVYLPTDGGGVQADSNRLLVEGLRAQLLTQQPAELWKGHDLPGASRLNRSPFRGILG